MDRKKIVSVLAMVMALIMILSLFMSVLPSAFAIDEDDIDELERKKEELTARVAEAQERVNDLRSEESNALEQKSALDVEKKSAEEAIAIVNKQLAIYDLKIAEKTIEVKQAKTVEEEQLLRYRTRVRAMEEEGGFNILVLLAKSHSLSEFLSSLDDAGAVMESDKALERQYRAAREESERLKVELEALRLKCEQRQLKLLNEKAEIEARIREAEEQLEALDEEITVALVEYQAAEDAEEAAAQEILALIAAYNEQKRREEEEARNDEGGLLPIPDPISTPSPVNPNPDPDPDPQPTQEPDPQPTQAPDPSGGGETGGGETGGGETGGGETGGGETGGGETGGGETGGGETGGGETGGGETGGETPAPTPAPTPTPTPAPTATPKPTPKPFSPVWPVPCSKRVTSRFGNRIDPFTGEVRYHSGIDIDGYHNDGKPIIAAADGTVVESSYNDSYGNYVILDHGNGYMTVYAHMSSRAVSRGQSVKQSKTIGYLGATGRATGTHCHYEVILNGSRINPAQFYTGISYWNC